MSAPLVIVGHSGPYCGFVRGRTIFAIGGRRLQTAERYAQILLHEQQKPGANGTAALNQKLVGLLNAWQQLGETPPRTLIDLIAQQLRVGSARDQTSKSRKKR